LPLDLVVTAAALQFRRETPEVVNQFAHSRAPLNGRRHAGPGLLLNALRHDWCLHGFVTGTASVIPAKSNVRSTVLMYFSEQKMTQNSTRMRCKTKSAGLLKAVGRVGKVRDRERGLLVATQIAAVMFCGCGRLMCGRAVPFRQSAVLLFGAAPRCRGTAPEKGMAVPVRRSLTAHQAATAADQDRDCV